MKKKMLSFILLVALVWLLYPVASLPTAAQETDKQAVIESLNEILCGISYYDIKKDVSQWPNDTVAQVIENKLYYSQNIDIQPIETGEYNVESCYAVTDIQKLTMDCFGRDFPKDNVRVKNDRVYFTLVRTEGSGLFVQNYSIHGEDLTAVGVAVSWSGDGDRLAGYFQATFRENPSSRYGYTLVSVKKIDQGKTFRNLTATASSELKESATTHRAQRTLDGDLKTAWAEGVSGSGINEWIKIYTSDGSKIELSAVELWLGYHKSQQLMERNGIPTQLLIETEDGLHQQAAPWSYSNDTLVMLDRPVRTSWIKFTIQEATPGTHYNDTCISEIRLIGVDCDAVFGQLPSSPQNSTTTSTSESQQPEQKSAFMGAVLSIVLMIVGWAVTVLLIFAAGWGIVGYFNLACRISDEDSWWIWMLSSAVIGAILAGITSLFYDNILELLVIISSLIGALTLFFAFMIMFLRFIWFRVVSTICPPIWAGIFVGNLSEDVAPVEIVLHPGVLLTAAMFVAWCAFSLLKEYGEYIPKTSSRGSTYTYNSDSWGTTDYYGTSSYSTGTSFTDSQAYKDFEDMQIINQSIERLNDPNYDPDSFYDSRYDPEAPSSDTW